MNTNDKNTNKMTQFERLSAIKAQYRKEDAERMKTAMSTIDGNEIKSLELILNQFPFNKLPETRSDVDFSNRNVDGWGSVTIPNHRGNPSNISITEKDGLRMWFVDFVNEWKETPILGINKTAPWHSKITVENKVFIDSANETKTRMARIMDSDNKKGFTID